MRRRCLLALAVTLLATAGSASAAVVYSDFGPGQSFSSTYHVVEGSAVATPSQSKAAEFTPAVNANLGSITLGFFWPGSATGTNSFGFALTTSAAGLPSTGAPLETWNSVSAGDANGDVLTLKSALNPALAAGQIYWITAVPGGTAAAGGWNLNNTGVRNLAFSFDSGATWHGDTETALAFEVDSQAASVVPTPAALPGALALLAGLLGAACLRRKATVR